MELDNLTEPEVALAVAATAAVLSPRARGWLRKGAVYRLAGILMAGDAVSSFARGVTEGAQQMTSTGEAPAGETTGASEGAKPETAGA